VIALAVGHGAAIPNPMADPASPTPPRPLITRRTVLGTLLLVGVAVGLYFLPDSNALWQTARARLDEWQRAVDDNLPLSVLVFSLAYQLLVTPPIPMSAVFALVGGALFGPWFGSAVLVVNSVLSATLAFLAARYLLGEWVRRNFGHRLRRLNDGVERAGGLYLFTLRWMPILPFFVINMGMGLTPIRLGKYVLVTALSMWPFTLLYAFAGSRIRELRTPRDAVSVEVLLAFSLLAVVPLLLKFVARRMLRRRAGVAVAVR